MSGENNVKDNHKDKALRIVEALSGVDAELVERSEKSVKSKKGKSVKKGSSATVIVLTKYLAACAVFIFVCVGGFGVYLTTWRAGSSSKNSEMAKDYAGSGAYSFEAAVSEGTDMISEEDGMITEADQEPSAQDDKAEESSELELEEKRGNTISEDIGKASQSVLTEQDSISDMSEYENPRLEMMSGSKKPEPQDTRSDVTLNEAKEIENIGDHIPDIIPNRFVPESCLRSSGELSYHDITIRWTDSDDYINLYITDYYHVMDGIYSLPDYMNYDNITNEVVDGGCEKKAGRTLFSMNIMFEDGVWAEVTVDADMTSEEIYKMLVSMGTVVID